MVYINSRGEVVDDTRATPANIFWKLITFFVLFFKTLIGIEDSSSKKNDNLGRGPAPGNSGGGGFFGGGGGGKPSDNKGPRKFGPKGFKSITDLTPPPMMGGCSGGACG
jgi:hypothetical protein